MKKKLMKQILLKTIRQQGTGRERQTRRRKVWNNSITSQKTRDLVIRQMKIKQLLKMKVPTKVKTQIVALLVSKMGLVKLITVLKKPPNLLRQTNPRKTPELTILNSQIRNVLTPIAPKTKTVHEMHKPIGGKKRLPTLRMRRKKTRRRLKVKEKPKMTVGIKQGIKDYDQ